MKIILADNNPRGRRSPSKWLWLPAVALVLAAGYWFLWGGRPAPPPPKPTPAVTSSGRMEGLSLTEIQEGDKRWVLAAQKADFHKERMEVSISGVQVEFFAPGEHVRVRADEGLFQTQTRVLTLKGQVEMKRGDLLIKTNIARYEPGGRMLLAPEEVLLEEPSLRVRGSDLKVELAARRLVLAQHRLTEVKNMDWGRKR